MNIKQATTIDEVIQFLDEIIATSKQNQNAIGYFPTLYREVTLKIKEGIATGLFQDGPRMEKLDVIFANRYFAAYFAFQSKQELSECWKFSFDKSQEYWPIVAQHLLLGINAHVNLDLGIACALVSTKENIDSLESDFNQINAILADLLGSVEKALTEIWPTMFYVLKLSGKFDNLVINFSMKVARDGAWKYAKEFVALPESQREESIKQRDKKVTKIAELVTNPGFIIRGAFKLIRIFEKGTNADKIVDLEEIH